MTSNEATLTDSEEQQFAELFVPADRLVLSRDWERVLRESINELQRDPTRVGGEMILGGSATVVDLAAERDARTGRRAWLVAASVLIISGMAVLGVFARNGGTSQITQVEVLSPEREVESPTIQRSDLPQGTTEVLPADDGLVSAVEDELRDETTFWRSIDGLTWIEVATLPMTNADVYVDGGNWVAAGTAPERQVEHPNVPGLQLATGIAVASSEDDGVTWETRMIEMDVAPSSGVIGTFQPASVTVAAIDDVIAVSYLGMAVADFTTSARATGLIGTSDHLVLTADSRGGQFFATGPEVFGAIDVSAEDLGWTDLELAERTDQATIPTLAVSQSGGDFTRADVVFDGLGFPTVVVNSDHEFEYGGLNIGSESGPVPQLFSSTDGVSWEAVPVASLGVVGEVEASARWSLGYSLETGEAVQSLDGGEYQPIPVPSEDVRATGAYRSSFGAVTFWQEGSLASGEVEVDGYVMETSVTDTFSVVAPDGTALVEGRSFYARSDFDESVVIETGGSVLLFDDEGQRLVLFGVDDVPEPVFAAGAPQFVGWSTDGQDWRFARVEGLQGGLWLYHALDGGLFGVDVLDPVEGVVIEWPSEMVDG